MGEYPSPSTTANNCLNCSVEAVNMTPGWDPRGVSLGLGREGMEGRGEPGHGLRRGEVMGEGQGMRTGLLPAGGGWEGGKGSVSSASWTPSNEERRNTCRHTS